MHSLLLVEQSDGKWSWAIEHSTKGRLATGSGFCDTAEDAADELFDKWDDIKGDTKQ